MKLFAMLLGLCLMASPVFAADGDVVDLTGLDTDQPVQSPSFENTTPAGQAPGGPIESEEE